MAVGVGQESFEGIQEAVPRERELQDRVTFSQVATAEYWGIDPANYYDIDETIVQAAAPERLRPFLIDVKRGESKMTAGYLPEGHNRERYISLYPYEYSLLSATHSPQRYGETAVAVALKGKAVLLSSQDQREQQAKEEGIKSVQRKHDDMQKYLNGQLRSEHGTVSRLLEAAQHPGLVRRRDVDTIVAAGQVRNHIIPQVLEVVGRNKAWTEQQYGLAQRAIDFRLFFARKNNQHLGNWSKMLTLLLDYDQEKINLFEDRVGAYAGYLAKHDKPSE